MTDRLISIRVHAIDLPTNRYSPPKYTFRIRGVFKGEDTQVLFTVQTEDGNTLRFSEHRWFSYRPTTTPTAVWGWIEHAIKVSKVSWWKEAIKECTRLAGILYTQKHRGLNKRGRDPVVLLRMHTVLLYRAQQYARRRVLHYCEKHGVSDETFDTMQVLASDFDRAHDAFHTAREKTLQLIELLGDVSDSADDFYTDMHFPQYPMKITKNG
jgi:hypothetical protein